VLQYNAVCCSATLQCIATHTATHCSRTLVASPSSLLTRCNTLKHTMQHIAIHIATHPPTHSNTLQHTLQQDAHVVTVTACHKLQHTASHRNTPHHTATHSNALQHTLQHIATRCYRTLVVSLPSHTATTYNTHCNTLQHAVTGR